jgi:hypothetical protein
MTRTLSTFVLVLLLAVAACASGCLYNVRGGAGTWSQTRDHVFVEGGVTGGTGIGDAGSEPTGFDMFGGLWAGAELRSGDPILSGLFGVEYIRFAAPWGYRLGAQSRIGILFDEASGSDEEARGWNAPQALGAATYALASGGDGGSGVLALGLEATAGYAIPLNDRTRGGPAIGFAITLEWTFVCAFSMSFR